MAPLALLLLPLWLALAVDAGHVRRGHVTNAQAFAAGGARDGHKMALPLPPTSFVQKLINDQMRMVPSGKKGKRHGHGQTVLATKTLRGVIEVTRSDGPTSYVSGSLNAEGQYTLTSNRQRAAVVTLPSVCPVGPFAMLASGSFIAPLLGSTLDASAVFAGSYGLLVPAFLNPLEPSQNALWSMPDCDTGVLGATSLGDELSVFDHGGNLGVTRDYELYNTENPTAMVLPLKMTFLSE